VYEFSLALCIRNLCSIGLLGAFLRDTDGWSLVQELSMTQWKSDNDTRFLHGSLK